MVRRYEMGATLEELAAELDCATTTARRHLAKRGAVIRSRGPEKGFKPKLHALPSNEDDTPKEQPSKTGEHSKPKRRVISFPGKDDW